MTARSLPTASRGRSDGILERSEAPGERTQLAAVADPRAHRRLPRGGRLGAAGTGWPGRLPASGPHVHEGRPGETLLVPGPRPLRAAVEDRRAARLGRRE